MRRIAVGLAAAVIAAGVGVAGRAEALPAYVLLSDATGQTLTSGDINWTVDSAFTCQFSGSSCSNLAMYLSGTGVAITGITSGGSPAFIPLSSVPGTGTDFSVTLEEFTTSGTASIGSASYKAIGGTGADSAEVTFATGGGTAPINGSASNSTIGNAVSGNPTQIAFTPVNDILYHMDNHTVGGLVTVGVSVPEPTSAALMALGIAALAFAARRGRAI